MYKGVYIGKNINDQSKKILVLGESHYSSDGNGDFTTKSVIKNMKNHPTEKKYQFFHKIAKSCGVECNSIDDEFNLFWDNVYFGNYIEDLCEIGTSTAKDFVSQNKETYNDSLFKFIKNNKIDIVLVFSRLTYKNLPSFSNQFNLKENLDNFDDGTLRVSDRRDWINHCVYLPNTEHQYTTIQLEKEVHFYGMRHPSARCGFDCKNYAKFLKTLFF